MRNWFLGEHERPGMIWMHGRRLFRVDRGVEPRRMIAASCLAG
jgi:hypothetical protein